MYGIHLYIFKLIQDKIFKFIRKTTKWFANIFKFVLILYTIFEILIDLLPNELFSIEISSFVDFEFNAQSAQ